MKISKTTSSFSCHVIKLCHYCCDWWN